MSDRFTLHLGDCLDVMATMEANSVDSVVTDPPYGLSSGENATRGFMGKEWDAAVPGPAFWEAALRVAKPGAYLLAFGGTRTVHRLACAIEDAGWTIEDQVIWIRGNGRPSAKQRLRAGHDPIVMASKRDRAKPAGSLRIDECRIPSQVTIRRDGDGPSGRWPANVIHDGSESVQAIFPKSPKTGWGMKFRNCKQHVRAAFSSGLDLHMVRHEFEGSTARYFYAAKATTSERDEGCDHLTPHYAPGDTERKRPRYNLHPTVKPTALMAYLCRLVTPQGGVVLDPFMGSGSTGKAAMIEGLRFIGIEREAEYLEIARARIEHQAGETPLFTPEAV